MDAPFAQDGPRLGNTFLADEVLQDALRRLLPREVHEGLAPEWRDLGEAAATSLFRLAAQAEAEPPRHVPYDAWGRRVDEVRVSPAWSELHREAARRGLAAVPYETGLGPLARIHHLALLHLYAPSSAIYSCPLAMTDGAARTLLEHGDEALRARAVPRLTSRDPALLWTSGQWMTERTGGSDVSGTTTTARRDGDAYRLHGDKWFTSAVTSEMALALAQTEAGLSLFYLELRGEDGRLDHITVNRLKDKLGTRALPTAELTLSGTRAVLVGAPGRGVKTIAPLLNITRLHNAVNACSMMARLLQLSRDYASRRVAFGRPLAASPLHRETLAAMHVQYEAGFALTLDAARLLGRVESGAASPEERLALRLLTPLAKLMTAKQAVAVASEALEGFGGAGYVEDTGLPVWLRNAQVLPIWEGTTNVLSLDVLRAAFRDGALEGWLRGARPRALSLADSLAGAEARLIAARLEQMAIAIGDAADADPSLVEASARALALPLAALAAAVPLCEQAAWGLARGETRTAVALRRWLEAMPALPDLRDAARLADSRRLSGLGE